MATQRRDDILDAFIRIVAKHGINKTTMRDVALEVGCSVGTIYNEFANKEALIDGFFERSQYETDQLLESLSGCCQETPEIRLRRFLVGLVKHVNLKMHQNHAFAELVKEAKHFRYIGVKTCDFSKTVKAKVITALSGILAQGVADGSFEVEDIPLTARLLREAFSEYLIPFITLERNIDDIVRDADDMCSLLIKALKSR